MTYTKKPDQNARFDTRLTKKQKEMFEKAAQLGGYRSLTDFVVLTVQEKATEIIREREQVIATEEDGKIFFEAVTGNLAPEEKLIRAAEEYRKKHGS